ncbi:peptidoglycan D,D-transpeptidase FtsI family protein [Nitratiruptor tergarcus]|uniref:Cell division protein FtsI (Penicillin-binding protein 3) n=1 Tax=Nitratiruptor tergarcus DSM 16512 TaxID=1069081 RepID=A0A1W1WQ43_9BACT|nr:penicillin-binding protein 2 [Nitratiruptor tergarcus]SMC08335.1 cell division protein FtsI (penicillin-binding protein 3) [Nitratiruptor tergarcus DSM 16512]
MQIPTKFYKIIAIFSLFFLGILIFLGVVFKIIVEKRKLPRLYIEEKNRALRGSIISAEGYQVAYSNKLYKVAVNTRCIDPQKKELFVRLFSIYSKIPPHEVRQKLRQKRGYVVLSYTIDTKTAYQLKILSRKLNALDIFIPYKVGQRVIKQGLTILESGETRNFPYGDTLTPAIGYVSKYEDSGYTKIKGIKGLEKYYESKISPKQDGVIRGKRDIGNNIILNKEAFIKKRLDGYNLHLNVNMLLQKNIENILDTQKADLEAKEIIAAVMESNSGKILAIASSNRYDPKNIQKRDLPSLNPKFTEYPFEPGSVMKPMTFSLLLEHGLVSPLEVVRGYNGRMKLGRKYITDEHKFDWLSAENVIVHSSNIGIAQLAQRLSYLQFSQGLKMLGFGKPTGVDLPYEKGGKLLPPYKLKSEIYKATVGYGYGMTVTFMQLLSAYNLFNNDGYKVTPRIAAFITLENGKRIFLKKSKKRKILSSKTVATMHNILQKVVEKGTGTVAKIDGLEIGGKTGTAHISRGGRYQNAYITSFFGFANDAKHRYTIGVTVFEPKTKHFASQTAAPIFRNIVIELINEGYLIPKNEQ